MPTQELSGRIRKPAGSLRQPLYAGLAGLPPLYIQDWSDETSLRTAGSSPIGLGRPASTSASICSLDSSTPSRWPWARSKDADEAMRRLADLARPTLGP
jgi:hypothetical protein